MRAIPHPRARARDCEANKYGLPGSYRSSPRLPIKRQCEPWSPVCAFAFYIYIYTATHLCNTHSYKYRGRSGRGRERRSGRCTSAKQDSLGEFRRDTSSRHMPPSHYREFDIWIGIFGGYPVSLSRHDAFHHSLRIIIHKSVMR